MKKRVAVLGSTGSIGISTLDVIRRHPDKFVVTALAASHNVAAMERQIREFKPKCIALCKESLSALDRRISRRVELVDALDGLAGIAARQDVDIVVLAVTGAAALDPFLAAVKAGKRVAPANKEALVMAGDIIMKAARQYRSEVIPVDSEQSAIFQCLEACGANRVHQIHLTASGGALLRVPLRQHNRFSVKDILNHPRWRMGSKITVDSATLMNKGFEVIEAMRLFDLSATEVQVVIHPEAIVHSLVEFTDGSILAQLGITDMRLPIQYALTYPRRFSSGLAKLDLPKLGGLTFEAPDTKKFPALALAYTAAREGGTLPAVMNAADEIAVDAFLKEKIKFTDIYRVVAETVRQHRKIFRPCLADIKEADRWARVRSEELVNRSL